VVADDAGILLVLTGVRGYISQDGHLVDVRVVFRVYSFEFWMECFVAGAGQAGIAFIRLDVRVSLLEVGGCGRQCRRYYYISQICDMLDTL
jgi:hypothetical protein